MSKSLNYRVEKLFKWAKEKYGDEAMDIVHHIEEEADEMRRSPWYDESDIKYMLDAQGVPRDCQFYF